MYSKIFFIQFTVYKKQKARIALNFQKIIDSIKTDTPQRNEIFILGKPKQQMSLVSNIQAFLHDTGIFL